MAAALATLERMEFSARGYALRAVGEIERLNAIDAVGMPGAAGVRPSPFATEIYRVDLVWWHLARGRSSIGFGIWKQTTGSVRERDPDIRRLRRRWRWTLLPAIELCTKRIPRSGRNRFAEFGADDGLRAGSGAAAVAIELFGAGATRGAIAETDLGRGPSAGASAVGFDGVRAVGCVGTLAYVAAAFAMDSAKSQRSALQQYKDGGQLDRRAGDFERAR